MNQLINRAILVGERASLSCFARSFRVSSQNMVIAVSHLSIKIEKGAK